MMKNMTNIMKLIIVDILFSGGESEKIPPIYNIIIKAIIDIDIIDDNKIVDPFVCGRNENLDADGLFLKMNNSFIKKEIKSINGVINNV
jgi:hypothetical protein